MKTITFTYEKKDGSKSERTLLVMVEPGNKYAGVDMSEMLPENAAQFAKLAKDLQSEYLSKINGLQQQYGLKFNYKQFLLDGMSDITVI